MFSISKTFRRNLCGGVSGLAAAICLLLPVSSGVRAASADLRWDGSVKLAQTKPAKKPAAPTRFETLVYKDWRVTCSGKTDNAKTKSKGCSGIRQLKDAKSGRLIFGWLLGLNPKKQLVTILQIPTGGVAFKKLGTLSAISIENGVKISVGKIEQSFKYQACAVSICEASGPLGRRMRQALSKASTVVVTFYTNQKKAINFSFKEDGIDQAIGAIMRQ